MACQSCWLQRKKQWPRIHGRGRHGHHEIRRNGRRDHFPRRDGAHRNDHRGRPLLNEQVDEILEYISTETYKAHYKTNVPAS